MRRREFIVLIGGAAAAWPLAVRGQQSMPVIGFLSTRSPKESTHLVEAFREGLKDSGYIENQNVRIEYRWAEGQYDRLAGLAFDLVGRRVAVIATAGNTPLRSARFPRRRRPDELRCQHCRPIPPIWSLRRPPSPR